MIALSEQERARVARVQQELEEGIAGLAHVGPSISIFGGARAAVDSTVYAEAHKLAAELLLAHYFELQR